MKKKKPIKPGEYIKAVTLAEGLKRSVDIANVGEVYNLIRWKDANEHSLRSITKELRRFRGKPFGFWRRK